MPWCRTVRPSMDRALGSFPTTANSKKMRNF